MLSDTLSDIAHILHKDIVQYEKLGHYDEQTLVVAKKIWGILDLARTTLDIGEPLTGRTLTNGAQQPFDPKGD